MGWRCGARCSATTHVDRAIERTTPFTADFQDLITRYAWGEIWSRPGLDRRTRSAITLTALVALGRHEELELHVRAALRNGLERGRDQGGAPPERDLLRRPGRQLGLRDRPARARADGGRAVRIDPDAWRVCRSLAVRTPVGRYGGGALRRAARRPGGARDRGGGRACRDRRRRDRGRLARLREPGGRGQPERRPDGGAARRPARSRSPA